MGRASGSRWWGVCLVGAATLLACTEEQGVTPGDAGGCSGTGCIASPDASNALPDSGTPLPALDATTPITSAADDLPCDVKAIVAAQCGACHRPGGAAPTALTGRADFLAHALKEPEKSVAASALARLTSNSNGYMMPPAGSPRLSASDLATLQSWLNAGTPARTGGACSVANAPDASVDPPAPPGQQCYKLLAHDAASKDKKYRVGTARDAYVNMTFKAPWGDQPRYAVSIKPIIDNAKVIHHWLLFDEAGVDGAVVPATGAHPIGQLLSGWAPGGDGVDLAGNPDDVGYELPGMFTIEFHYNSSDANAEDASGVEICLMDHTPKNVAALSWLGTDNLVIPSDHWTGQCVPASNQPIHIVGVTPHMHKAGLRMVGTIHRKGGKDEVLHDQLFDFDYQHSYAKNVVLNPGDTITTECYYDKPTLFGESTDAEMCYLFTYAYPKGALADLGAWGAVAHGGSACLN